MRVRVTTVAGNGQSINGGDCESSCSAGDNECLQSMSRTNVVAVAMTAIAFYAGDNDDHYVYMTKWSVYDGEREHHRVHYGDSDEHRIQGRIGSIFPGKSCQGTCPA